MKILIDPGHGYYLYPEGGWRYQRNPFGHQYHGFIEDLGTARWARFLSRDLSAKGHEVLCTRPLIGEGGAQRPGPSSEPRWKEGSLYWLRYILDGHPEYQELGATDRAKDINCRPLYANMKRPEIAISLHHNASDTNPNAHGVVVFYRENDEDSVKLAEFIYENLVKDQRFDGGRGIKPREPGWAWFRRMDNSIVSVLVEFLFFTNEQDNEYLRDEANLEFASRAVLAAVDRLEWERQV